MLDYPEVVKRSLAAAASLAVFLAACSSSVPGEDVTEGDQQISPPATENAPEGLEQFYGQDVEWGACEGSRVVTVECADITVPLDYDNPEDGSIEISAMKMAASGQPQGSLFVNPGGPGASGKEMAENAAFYFSSDLRAHYDIIGFDPRGVGDSSPIDCMPDDQLGELLDKSYPDTDEGERDALRDSRIIIDSCLDGSGDLLPFVSTVNAAKDMDIMRAAIGESQFDYLGFSYGTHLGGQYADLFPDKVGRMVLDGAVDPAVSSLDSSYFQAVGFEQALDAYIESCLDDADCPLSGSDVEEAKQELQEVIEATEDNPLPTAYGSREVGPGVFYTGIATTLYSEDTWSFLTEGLSLAIEQGDGSFILMFNDLMIGRDTESGEFADNSLEARWAINCIDFPAVVDEDLIEENDVRLHEDAPTFAPYFEGGDSLCGEWPFTADEVPGPFVAEGSNPIIVIGTKGDPATPYQSSVNLAEQLANGSLLTWEGEGHTAYGSAGPCIDDAVDSFFINGAVPEDGLTCPA